jgi:hypothetical protein
MLRTGQLFDFPLRREDLSSRRGVNYRGPWRLLGPDLHRLANASLSLGLLDHHLLFTSPPEQSGRTRVHLLGSCSQFIFVEQPTEPVSSLDLDTVGGASACPPRAIPRIRNAKS